MGRNRKLYIATNIETGEQIIGDTLELYAAIDISTKSVYYHSSKNTLYNKIWKIDLYKDSKTEKIPRKYVEENISKIKASIKRDKKDNELMIRKSDCMDWDKTTAVFKAISKKEKIKEEERKNKRNNKFRTPYNVQR